MKSLYPTACTCLVASGFTEGSLTYSTEQVGHFSWFAYNIIVWYFNVVCACETGSSHINQEGKSPANSQNPSPANTPTHRGARYPVQITSGQNMQHSAVRTFGLMFMWCATRRYDRIPDQMRSPSYSPPPQSVQRSFCSPENLQKQAVVRASMFVPKRPFFFLFLI